jgi:uncharacterized protein (DUF488 family)
LATALRAHGVTTLVDVRHFPRSRTNPQFDGEKLATQLPRAGVAYVAMQALGGRRPKSRDVDPQRNAGWRGAAFKNYADYAETAAFRDAMARLVELARASPCAVMCAEAVWWRCHRRIVADHAIARGLNVVHIMTATTATPGTPTPFARIDRKRNTVRYPAATS